MALYHWQPSFLAQVLSLKKKKNQVKEPIKKWNMNVSPDHTKEKEHNVRSHSNSAHIAIKTIFPKLLLFVMHI